MNVTLTVWRVPARQVPAVAWRLPRDRRRLRRTPGVRFAKLLGTSRGMDPTRWAALIVTDAADVSAAGATGANPTGALTRARLRPTRAPRFWGAIGPVARAVSQAPGLLTTFGIGAAPIGWQGTVSLWARIS